MREIPSGVSKTYWVIVSLIASLGGFLFGFDTAVISGAISFLEAQYKLDSVFLGWLVSSALITCIIGAGFAGILSDLYGRRRLLLVCAVVFLASAFGCAFATSFAILVLARMVGGLAIGAVSMLSPLYIAEFAPARLRGGSVWQLLEPRWRRPLLIGIVLPLAGQISGINSIIYYGSKIFEQAGFSVGASLGGQITVGTILCLFTLLALGKVDSWGRRPLLLAGTLGCAVALF